MGQELIASDSPRHFFVPLPRGLSQESAELFGFFVYELRAALSAERALVPALRTGGEKVDGGDHRNVLLSRKRAEPARQHSDARDRLEAVGIAEWSEAEVDRALRALNLPRKARLSVLAVETLPELDRKLDPLGADLGHVRIMRTSPLIPVADVCL